MKRLYIKPVTEKVVCTPISMIAQSTNWGISQGEGQDPDDIDPTTEPDPSGGGGAKNINFWDESF